MRATRPIEVFIVLILLVTVLTHLLVQIHVPPLPQLLDLEIAPLDFGLLQIDRLLCLCEPLHSVFLQLVVLVSIELQLIKLFLD